MKVGDLVKINQKKLAKHSHVFDDSYMETLGDCTGILVRAEGDILDFPELPYVESFTVLFRNGKKMQLTESWLLPIENEE